jgi:hypothetical protein
MNSIWKRFFIIQWIASSWTIKASEYSVEMKESIHMNSNYRANVAPHSSTFDSRLLKTFFGDSSCPCLTLDSLPPPPQVISDENGGALSGVDFDSYGINCGSHDQHVGRCRHADHQILQWCNRAWCWVDSNKCSIRSHQSLTFTGRWYSYATCRNLDFWEGDARIANLNGRILRLSFVHNDESYKGSRSLLGVDFNGTLDDWLGPTVDLIKISAERANMQLHMVNSLPYQIQNKTLEFFGPTANGHDWCVYAVSLGLIDICASLYQINTRWDTSCPFIELGTLVMRLVIQEDFFRGNDLNLYSEAVKTIFKPFALNSWAFIIFVALPLLSTVILINEYGALGSVYPKYERVLKAFIDDSDQDKVEIKERFVSFGHHYLRGTFAMSLAFMKGHYRQRTVSLGGKITLLGLGFLLLITQAVYTANLSTYLVASIRFGRVDTLEDVVKRNHRICAIRPVMEKIISIHSIDENFFVVDPIDGKPGFSCPLSTCKDSRRRVFDFLDPNLADAVAPNEIPRHCHVAITWEDDLTNLQHFGEHCNKTMPGTILAENYWGMPVSEFIFPQMSTLIIKLKNENLLQGLIAQSIPEKKCFGNKVTVEDETAKLNITQLSGIWLVSFLIAIGGLVVTLIQRRCKKRFQKHQGYHIHILHRYDQSGQQIHCIPTTKALFLNHLTDHIFHDRRNSLGSSQRFSAEDSISNVEMYSSKRKNQSFFGPLESELSYRPSQRHVDSKVV